MKVSIIVPVYNTKDYIGRLLSSIENQTYGNWELILVDDHSRDGTYNLLKEFKELYPDRVEVLRTPKPRSGPSVGRNLGLEVSSGRFVAFIDSDDWWSEDFLEKTVEGIKGVDAVITNYYDVFENGKRIAVTFKSGDLNWRDVLRLKVRFGNGNSLLRRRIVENWEIRFPQRFKYAEDTYFYMAYAAVTDKYRSIDINGFYHLARTGSLVKSSSSLEITRAKIFQVLAVYESLCRFVEENCVHDTDEFCTLLFSHWRVFSLMTYINSLAIHDKRVARQLFLENFRYLRQYRPSFSYNSVMTLVWMLDLFVPVKGVLREIIK